MARPKTEDPEARAKILAAAERLFAERGLTGVAVRELAAKAGVNGAMIHYYFGNKDGLYDAVIENAASTVRSLIADATGSDASAKERLTSFVSAYAEYILSHPNLARILSREMLSGGQHFHEAHTEIRAIKLRAAARGDVRRRSSRRDAKDRH